jgi:hypothetical protein
MRGDQTTIGTTIIFIIFLRQLKQGEWCSLTGASTDGGDSGICHRRCGGGCCGAHDEARARASPAARRALAHGGAAPSGPPDSRRTCR